MKDNFWEMGETGPCGPCSEIHIDSRPAGQRASTPGRDLVNADHEDVIELWNLVFIQFNRSADGLRPLPAQHVDTGMGLERITRVIQGKRSNYDTDLFTPIFEKIRAITGAGAYTGKLEHPTDIAYRVIADHIRTLVFAITDGADPSNEGRGYVLRRILRRAVRHGRQTLGATGPFLCELAPTVVENMGDFFPELKKNPQRVIDVIREEEESFGKTLDRGIELFSQAATKGKISAADAFKLHDTYGFPIDLTQIMAEERGMTVDVAGFEKLMAEARDRSRGAGDGGASANTASALTTDAVASLHKLNIPPTDDSKIYEAELRPHRATIRAIWTGANFDENIVPGSIVSAGASQTGSTGSPGVSPVNPAKEKRVAVILDKSNFYANAGGQVGDAGRLVVTKETRTSAHDKHEGGEFVVADTRQTAGYVLHIGTVRKGELRVGDTVELRLDKPRRKRIMANHTATHLLNFALREALGDHIDQKGSLVAADRLRFDFSHPATIAPAQVEKIERIVREQIAQDRAVFVASAPVAVAQTIAGVRAVFGEKYPDPVRVVSIGAPVDELLAKPDNPEWRSVSVEFCGGTHLSSTGEAQAFTLIQEEAVAKGVRRVVALTGVAASEAIEAGVALRLRTQKAEKLTGEALENEVRAIASALESAALPYIDKIMVRSALSELHGKLKSARKVSAAARRDEAISAARTLADDATGDAVIGVTPAGGERPSLLAAMDVVRARRPQAAVMLFSVDEAEGKVLIAAGVPSELIQRGIKAGDWVRVAAGACGGKGGGRPDSAQGGGAEVDKLPQAMESARRFAEKTLKG